MRSVFIAAAAAILLGGCVATMPTQGTSAPPSVTTTRDEFKKLTEYRGSDVYAATFDTLFVRAWRPDGKPVFYQIYVAHYYSGEWKFYTSAYDIDGFRHDVTQIGRDVGPCSRYGCRKTETLGLNVTRAYLEKYRSTGIKFKVVGRAGEQVFDLPAAFISSFLDGVSDDSSAPPR